MIRHISDGEIKTQMPTPAIPAISETTIVFARGSSLASCPTLPSRRLARDHSTIWDSRHRQ